MNSNKKTALYIVLGSILMFGMAFAFVPLYDIFCRLTGFGGVPQQAEQNNSQILDREVIVRFQTNISDNLDWQFNAEQQEIKVNIGASNLAIFTAKNNSKEDQTGMAIFNVSPAKAAAYFVKTECFCFEEQKIKAGKKANFPVSFYIDPAIMSNDNLDDVKIITLSYVFFKNKD